MPDLNKDKYIELLVKYKTQATIAICMLFMVGIYFAGRASVSCPPKSKVCESEIKTNNKLFAEIEKCQADTLDKIREQIDKDEVECKKRIRSAINDHKVAADGVTCHEAKAIMPQCKRRRLWK